MGRMSDLHIEYQHDTMSIENTWFELVTAILEKAEFGKVTAYPPPESLDYDEYSQFQSSPDFSIAYSDKTRTAVELKIYRWHNDWRGHTAQAIEYLNQVIKDGNFSKGILIISWDTGPEEHTIKNLRIPDNIELWDIKKLRSLAAGDKQLENTLEEHIHETQLHFDEYSGYFPDSPYINYLESEVSPKGQELFKKIKKTNAGKPDWNKFEELCCEAIKLLFGKELQSWSKQNRTEDGLHRMDLIGRINVNSNSFWSVIEYDFRTRYVVFEAKNYTNEIKQGEIYTTEKYLFTKALRSVAIIIARNGFDDGAKRAAIGSLREQGKLILLLTMKDLGLMLQRYDQGDAPENLLYDKMDELLMSVGR